MESPITSQDELHTIKLTNDGKFSEAEILSMFREYGKMTITHDDAEPHYSFIHFLYFEDFVRCLEEFNLLHKEIEIQPELDSTGPENGEAPVNTAGDTDEQPSPITYIHDVLVTNIPVSYRRADVIRLCKPFNPVFISKLELTGVRYNIIYCRLQMENENDCELLIAALDGMFLGDNRLIVRKMEEFLALL